ncbi:protein ECT2 isoform X2 [Culicoides brevitarsis]|uniref:protein ECT2 isoform X2 n=1 Tax=Culicoides brevitarsis TaxID=469753 RepID=UPI00307C8720
MESLQEEQTSRRQSGSDVEMTTAPNSRGESQELTLPITKQTRICLVGGVCDDANTLQAAQKLGVPVIISETGLEYITDEKWNTYFVLDDFEGNNYSKINHAKQKILGPPALKYAVESGEGLPNNNRPIYNYAMRGTTTCFTGIRQKNVLIRLVNLIHFMGGSIRKDMNTKVTHLICNSSIGEKYQYAMTFRLPAIRPSWVTEAWESRDKEKFCAKEETFLREHKLKVFEGQKVCFFGFPPEEHQHMIDVLKSNGGIPTDMEDPECSHVVVDEHVVQAKPEVRNNRTHIVKSDWFWYTIQNGYADETDYLFGDYLDSIANTPGAERRDSYPISFNKRKRKRLSQRILGDGTPVGSGTNKRRSSVSDAGLLSVSGSFLDCTATPEKHDGSKVIITDKDSSHELPSAKQMSMRRNHFMDFFHTESNYVGILETICKVFKEPLEKMLEENPEDSLLNSTELKGIFSNFLPIYEVHMKMLNMLKDIHSNWVEDCLIGQIIIKHRDDLLKAYPPYVNFFEQMKETLVQCDSQKPRFHAFLKICQTKPECGRQTLQDLMIRPVQRLPSISLLLKDILKHTAKTNPDHKCLSDALGAITEVMHDINEDKRKMEGQLAIFEIFNDIDNCPPHLVSSHRSFVSKLEVTELTDSLSGRGDSLVLFLFSDTLEVCKKRSRGFGTIKSPGTNALNSVKIQQEKKASYKHYKMMPLSSIRYVIDIHDNPRAFAINCKLCGDIKDKLYSFSICDEECDKIIYLKTLCKQMAENACRTETDKCLISCNSEELGIDVTDVNVGTLSRAFKFATKTRLKVGRAFSFNKTPSKLKRAVSTMMTSPTFGSTNSLTPSTQMAQMKLASCTNLNDHNSEDTVSQSSSSPTSSEILLAPMTVQPTRKNRVPIAALRRI